MNKTLIVVVGPTAIGKTSLSIALAKYFSCEIVSADSRQFYKEMRIGTAVPYADELAQARHHFIQHKSISENYSVGDFEKEAIQLLSKLFKDQNLVVLVGGSGLYINAVTKGLDDFPKVTSEIQDKVKKMYQNQGITALQFALKKLDPTHYHTMDIQNPQRVIRALQVCMSSGKPYSSFLTNKTKKRSFNVIKIGLTADRKVIYDRINQRVDLMIKEGLIEEATKLYPHKTLNALNTVGYKEIFSYLDGDFTRDFAIEEIKKNTRRFAKRQLTWFRKDQDIHWFDYKTDTKKIIALLKSLR